jgi:hypothetical protein
MRHRSPGRTCSHSSGAVSVTGLDALLTEYRTVSADLHAAEDPDSQDWSPIRAACLEPDANRVAREIANLLTARLPAPV